MEAAFGDMSIDMLELEPRVHNALMRSGIRSVGEMLERIEFGTLQRTKNVGPIGFESIVEALRCFDLVVCRMRAQLRAIQSQLARLREVEESTSLELQQMVRAVRTRVKEGTLDVDAKIRRHKISHILREVSGQLTRRERAICHEEISLALRNPDLASEIAALFANHETREMEIVLLRIGDNRPTLETLAKAEGVTRERIRQIESNGRRKLRDALHKSDAVLTNLQTALVLFADNGLLAGHKTHTKRLREIGLLGDWNSLWGPSIKQVPASQVCMHIAKFANGQGSAAISDELCSEGVFLEHDIDLYVSEVLEAKFTKVMVKEMRRQARLAGAMDVSNWQQKTGCSGDEIRFVVSHLGLEKLTLNWYGLPAPKRPGQISGIWSFAGPVLKQALHCGSVSPEQAYYGCSRHDESRGVRTPPMNILLRALLRVGFEKVEGHLIWPYSNPATLSRTEQVVVDAVANDGPVMTFRELVDAIDDAGLTLASLPPALKTSPIIVKAKYARYAAPCADKFQEYQNPGEAVKEQDTEDLLFEALETMRKRDFHALMDELLPDE